MLSAEGLTLWRGATCLFEDLGFQVGHGEALLVRGPNGAGKTTLLRVIAGLTLPETGTIRWQDRPVEAALREPPALLTYCGHAPALKADLSVRENLAFYARLSGAGAARVDEVIAEVGLSGRTDLDVRYLSAGQKRRAAMARVLLSGASLWLLDEPQTNLDAAGRALVEGLIARHLRAGGLAVIAAHQAMDLGELPRRELQLGTG